MLAQLQGVDIDRDHLFLQHVTSWGEAVGGCDQMGFPLAYHSRKQTKQQANLLMEGVET